MGATVLTLLRESEFRLKDVDSPRLSAEILMAEVLGVSRLSLVIDRERVLTEEELERIDALIKRRQRGEPVAYILGTKEFYGFDFKVSPETLIPRPETEHIIEKAEALYSRETSFRFADLGTGSGILGITLALLFPHSRGVAVDLSRGALAVAQENAVRHGVADRILFQKGDFTLPLLDANAFELIVSNPPYVPQYEFEAASPEVTSYEPEAALVSGEDGLNHIRAMLPLVATALRSKGRLLMEIGYQQGNAIQEVIVESFSEFCDLEIIRDYAGHDRVVCLAKK